MAAATIINLTASVDIVSIEVRANATGENTIAYITAASTSLSAPTFYATTAAASADSDLDAGDLAGILAMFAAGGANLGGVYVSNYDTSTEDARDALDALVAAGYVPGWHYMHIVVAERVDAEIDFAADWVAALAVAFADLALVYGQLSTSSIISGTVPATTGASAGASKVQVCYDDRGASYTVERYAATLAGNSRPISDSDATAGPRPAIGYVACPTSVGQMTADLTQAQLVAATGRGASQARCIAHAKVTPTSAVDDRIWAKGYTLGATLADVEYSVARIKLDILSRIASILRTRAHDNNPIRSTQADLKIVTGSIGDRLKLARQLGYLERRPTADAALGTPALPDAYLVTGSVSGETITVAITLGFAADVRTFTITGIGYVG
jgi:hypothetical protein